MPDASSIWLSIAVMAGVTYAIRVLPLVLLRREIRHPIIRAFLHYVPYATLSAMTIPAAILGAPSFLAGGAGVVVAIVLAMRGVSMVLVAAIASLVVWVLQFCG